MILAPLGFREGTPVTCGAFLVARDLKTRYAFLDAIAGAQPMDFLNRQHTAQSVALATGATAKQITDWCNQGLILGQREPLGRGHKRLFSWFNVIEIAGALALMEIGIKSPGDAFRASVYFAHVGEGDSGWAGDGGDKSRANRLPSLPFHHNRGETYLLVSEGNGHVVLSADGKVNPSVLQVGRHHLLGFIALNMTELFMQVAHRMALDGREVLDEAYPEDATA